MQTDELTVRAVVEVLEQLYPPATAQSWDRVGLVTGDTHQPVRRVHLAVDPTLAVIAEARDAGADMLITHHPLLLRGVHSLATDTAKGAGVTTLIRSDIALYCAHTNADVADPGVGHALAAAVGLGRTEPLQVVEDQELGRVGDLPEAMSLRAFAEQVCAGLPPAPAGIRVSGDPEATVRRIAVLGGAGDTAFDAVRRAGADVYVTADLRHHPALEAREEAWVAARSGRGDAAGDGGGAHTGTPYLIDAGHWASEWLWLDSVRERLAAALGQRGTSVDLHISTLCTDPWDFVVGAAGPGRHNQPGGHE